MILDADPKNLSCVKKRNRDIENIKKLHPTSAVSRTYNMMLASDLIYYIDGVNPTKLVDTIEILKKNNDQTMLDYIFIDSPGAVEDKGYTETLKVVEHILIPLKNDEMNDDNTVDFYDQIMKSGARGIPHLKTVNIFYNDVQYALDKTTELLLKRGVQLDHIYDTFIKHNKSWKTGLLSIIPLKDDLSQLFAKEFLRRTK
jgi:cellulose biosynthesis protein BcsQ